MGRADFGRSAAHFDEAFQRRAFSRGPGRWIE